MKKLALIAIALGSLAVACAPPTTINVTPSSSDGGNGGSTNNGGEGGSEETTTSDPGTTTPDEKPSAHSEYVKNVHPSLIETCGGCHNPDGTIGAPVFLDYDVELSYSLIKAYPGILKTPAESILITKPPHTGPASSDGQKEIIGKWLTMELDELGGGGEGGSGSTGTMTQEPVTLETMLEEFANCMDLDIWTATGMDQLPLQQTTGEGPCYSCHSTGTGALWFALDPTETFEQNKIFPYIMRLVTPVYQGSNPVDLAPSNRILNKGKEPCANPPICHPKFELSPANKQAFETFVSTTLTKWQSGACAKP